MDAVRVKEFKGSITASLTLSGVRQFCFFVPEGLDAERWQIFSSVSVVVVVVYITQRLCRVK